jgi:hypothetical protein
MSLGSSQEASWLLPSAAKLLTRCWLSCRPTFAWLLRQLLISCTTDAPGMGAVHRSPEGAEEEPRLLLTMDDVLPEACPCGDAHCDGPVNV